LDQDQETQLGKKIDYCVMQMFEEDRRRAAYRRYLAELRISYGNAISDSNKRIQAVQAAQSPFRSQFGDPGQPISRVRRPSNAESPARLATSNSYSWQLSSSMAARSVTTPSTTTPLSKDRKRNGMAKGLPVKKDSMGDTNLRQYEMLQKRALANSLLAEFLSDNETLNKQWFM